MKLEELQETLSNKGFEEEKQDTGIRYIKTSGNLDFICYIEPGIEIEFISIYNWNDNNVKGTFNLSVKEMNTYDRTVASLFMRTKNNIPEYIGEKINVHSEINNAVNNIFE